MLYFSAQEDTNSYFLFFNSLNELIYYLTVVVFDILLEFIEMQNMCKGKYRLREARVRLATLNVSLDLLCSESRQTVYFM